MTAETEPLTPEELDALHSLLMDEIGTFGYTQDVTPRDWVEVELETVAKVREKVLRFEADRRG